MNLTFSEASSRSGERGAVLVMALGVLVIVGALAASLAGLVTTGVESHLAQTSGNEAFYMAESGARYAIARIRALGPDAVAELDGRTFALANNWGFELDVAYTDTGSSYLFQVDSVGFAGGGANSKRQSVNGYQIEIPKSTTTADLPVSFRYGVEMMGGSAISLSGAAYMDSYDSAVDEVSMWSWSPGRSSEATVRVARDEDVLNLNWSTRLYGSISVPAGTDISNPSDIVNRPENVLGEPKIVAEDNSPPAAVPPPEEEPEISKPVSWDPIPSFRTSGSDTIDGGNFSENRDFSPGSTALTVDDSLGLNVGRDFRIGSSGSIDVEGDFSAWTGRDFDVGGGGSGLVVGGDADIQVGRNFEVGASQTVVVEGDLDLDVDGTFSISGSGTLHVKGDAYIDVGGDFSISGGGKLVVDGRLIVRARDGLSFTGWSSPLVFGENGSALFYVDSGDIRFATSTVSTPDKTTQFVVIGGEDVSSLSITGDSRVSGALYVPHSEFSITGSSQLFGAVVAESIHSFGGGTAIHQDLALLRASTSFDFDELPVRRYWVAVGD